MSRGAAVALLALLALVSTPARAAKNGSICIAPVSGADRAPEADPSGQGRPPLKYDFYVQIDRGKKIRVPRERGVSVSGLDTSRRHSVTIWDGNGKIESFVFTFEERGSNRLCLEFAPFYWSWRLDPPRRRPWCRCR